MTVRRTQTLVQLDESLVASLDERAGARGTSRSALIRVAIEAYLAADVDASIDAAILEGYRRVPATEPSPITQLTAQAAIDEEPW